MRPLVVLESHTPDDVADVLGRLRSAGWRTVSGWEPGVVAPNERIVCTGRVRSPEDAAAAVLAAVSGAGVVAVGEADRPVLDQLCDDLRRFGPLDHRLAPDCSFPALSEEAMALLRLLADGLTLGAAAKELHLSRRTADRRLAEARGALGASSTAEALVAARRAGLLAP